MQFEPRLIRPDEEPDDWLELPPDLVELAVQLSADAHFLATRFPASTEARSACWENAVCSDVGPERVRSHDFGRRLVRATAAAMLLTGIGLWGGRLWSIFGNHQPRGAQAVVSQIAEDARSGNLPADRFAGDGFAGDGTATGLPLPFRSLTAGEQEGVLDLLEEQPLEEAQVSI